MYGLVSGVFKRLFSQEDGEGEVDEKSLALEQYFLRKNGLQENEAENESEIPFIEKTGKITRIGEEYGLIDDDIYFDLKDFPNASEFVVGDSISYIVCKMRPNEAFRVIQMEKLNPIEDGKKSPPKGSENHVAKTQATELKTPAKEVKPTTVVMQRILNGQVIAREGNELTVKPQGLVCDLNKVKAEFSPIPGDWLSLLVSIAIDDDDESNGRICEIISLKPVLMRERLGNITYLQFFSDTSFEGVIENEIFFSTEWCDFDFKPQFGQQVNYKALESEQGMHKWRAMTVKTTSPRVRKGFPDKSLECSKNGVSVTGSANFGDVELNTVADLTVELKNSGHIDRTLLETIFFAEKKSQFFMKTPTANEKVMVRAGSSLKCVISCKAQYLGLNTEIVFFCFEDFRVGKYLEVNVTLDKEGAKYLPLTRGPFLRDRSEKDYSWNNFSHANALCGARPMIRSKFSKSARNSNYAIPEALFKIILQDRGDQQSHQKAMNAIEEEAPSLQNCLSPANYADRFHNLLYLEEVGMKLVYRRYDLKDVVLKPRNDLLSVDISKVIDDRMKIFLGSTVVLSKPSETKGMKQVGFVYDVRENEVRIKFHPSFHATYNGGSCNLMFEPSRTTFVRSHIALEKAVENLGVAWLFPTEVTEKPPLMELEVDFSDPGVEKDFKKMETTNELSVLEYKCDIDDDGYVIPMEDEEKMIPPAETEKKNPSSAPGAVPEPNDSSDNEGSRIKLTWFNPNLNHMQKKAVVNVIEARGRPLPYIIHGPPGTGKTLTLLETILQIYHLITDSRILIGTPSNSACNLLCEHLIATGKFTPGEMVRILSLTRTFEGTIPENVIPYCTAVGEAVTCLVPRPNPQSIRISSLSDTFGTQRIILGTCCALGILHNMGVQQGHFSHVIIDEAAQATEPEALIPLCFLNPKNGQAILCGDPEQLGPICISQFNQKYELGRSLLERLSKMIPYTRNKTRFHDTNGYDPRVISRLNVNYRSVPEILKLPSKLFYESELIPTVSQAIGREAELISRFNFETEARGRPAAVIFHGIRSENMREERSTSWFNLLEVWQGVVYLKRLYSSSLTPDEIGIITPYQKQVEKFRELIRSMAIVAPKIGSVEEFQGQERHAIIFSAVRSNAKNANNLNLLLKFVSVPRRINVAITRARAILIIIGNPIPLSADPTWSQIIRYCIENHSYVGCPIDGLIHD